MVEGKNDFPISHRASPGKPLYGDGKRRKKGRRKKGTANHDGLPSPGDDEIIQNNFMVGAKTPCYFWDIV